jgi:Mn2+/Fe2+ NRAMP family transporter
MPHNIYLHSALVRARKLPGDGTSHGSSSEGVAGSPRRTDGGRAEAILYHAIEGGGALVLAVLINFMVMAVFAAGFNGTPAADDIGLSSAGECALPLSPPCRTALVPACCHFPLRPCCAACIVMRDVAASALLRRQRRP